MWPGDPSLESLAGAKGLFVQESKQQLSGLTTRYGHGSLTSPGEIKSETYVNSYPGHRELLSLIETFTMLSLNTEVLSEKGMRSTVACYRSHHVNTFLFSGAFKGKCASLGKAVSSVPPLVRVPPVIHFALLTVQLGMSLGIKLVSFEIIFRYSYEHSSLQVLLLLGIRMRDQACLSPKPAFCASWNMTLCP